jgi:predicted membrane metal-binding protein
MLSFSMCLHESELSHIMNVSLLHTLMLFNTCIMLWAAVLMDIAVTILMTMLMILLLLTLLTVSNVQTVLESQKAPKAGTH